MRSWGWGPRDENRAFIRDQRVLSLSPSPFQVRIQQEGSHMQAQKRAFTRTWSNWHPDLGLLVFRTVRNKILWFKPPGLRYFVIAAWAGEDTGMASVWLATGVQSWSLESCFSHPVSELSLPSWGSILKKLMPQWSYTACQIQVGRAA